MSPHRKFLFLLMLLLAVPLWAASALAAPPQGGGYGRGGRGEMMSPDQQLKRMTKEFNLTADQQSKIKPILVDEQKKMEDARNDSSLDRQAMREKMMQIRRDRNDQVRALLDDQQQAKFDKLEQEREAQMRNRRGGGPSGPGSADSGNDNSGGNAPPPQK